MDELTDRELDAYLAENLNRWDWDAVYHESRAPLLSSTGDGMILVLEAMRGLGFEVDVLTDDGEWCCDFDNGTVDTHSVADTAPRAVAEAAKMALEATK